MARQPVRKKMYRTMQGRMVDIDKLRSSNLETPAVGNMGVNARGDVLGKNGQIIKSKDAVMKQYYETPKGKAQDTTVKKTQKVTPIPQPRVEQVQVMNPTVEKVKPTPVNIIKKAPKKEEPKSGIDAALDGLE
jgi:outer membrane biosynthesis protein TonB